MTVQSRALLIEPLDVVLQVFQVIILQHLWALAIYVEESDADDEGTGALPSKDGLNRLEIGAVIILPLHLALVDTPIAQALTTQKNRKLHWLSRTAILKGKAEAAIWRLLAPLRVELDQELMPQERHVALQG